MSETPEKKRNVIVRAWNWFWSPSSVISIGFTLIAGFLAGILFWGGFHWTLEMTNTEEFCVSCHTMETNLGEYRETIHYNNHSGVRAICSDCHVPHEWQHKIKAKVMAVKDIYHEIAGTMNTPEKYEEHRLHLAEVVWTKMKESDSRECRNCHNFEYMDFTIQETRAADQHQHALDNNMTCIDCHQGIAHHLPAGYKQRYDELVDQLAGKTPSLNSHGEGASDVAAIRTYLDTSRN